MEAQAKGQVAGIVPPPVVLDEATICERLYVLIPAALGNGCLDDIYRLDDYLLSFRPRDVKDDKLRALVEAARDHVNTWTPETRKALQDARVACYGWEKVS